LLHTRTYTSLNSSQLQKIPRCGFGRKAVPERTVADEQHCTQLARCRCIATSDTAFQYRNVCADVSTGRTFWHKVARIHSQPEIVYLSKLARNKLLRIDVAYDGQNFRAQKSRTIIAHSNGGGEMHLSFDVDNLSRHCLKLKLPKEKKSKKKCVPI